MISAAGAGILYDFGGLRLRSTFVLPGLSPIAGERPPAHSDTQISSSPAPPPRGQPVCQWRGRYQLNVESLGHDWLIRHGDQTGVTIASSGQALRCHCQDPESLPLLAEIMVRRILPRLVVLRGGLTIHAATLGDGTGATMLLGSSGSGKSTMTAALERRLGWDVFGDDMAVIGDEGRHMVFPTVPGASLSRESWPGLVLRGEVGRPLQSAEDKLWYAPARATAPPPQPLEAVILLSLDADGGGIQYRRLSGPSALVQVSSQLVSFNSRDAGEIARLLARVRRLIVEVPIYSLAYPRDYRALPDVVDTIRRLRADAQERRAS